MTKKSFPVGRYWIGMNEELFLFPSASMMGSVGRGKDESLTFGTRGLSVGG